MALNSVYCADEPLSNYSLTHWLIHPVSVFLDAVSVKEEFHTEVVDVDAYCSAWQGACCFSGPPTDDYLRHDVLRPRLQVNRSITISVKLIN